MRTKFLLAIVAMLLFASGLTAQTPYAVYCEGDKSFHFLVSDTELTLGETLESNGQTITNVWEVDLNQENYTSPVWFEFNAYQSVTKVVFDKSFITVQPTCCQNWFMNFNALKEIEGFQFFNSEKVTNMSNMFNGCTSLISLDLSSLNTSNVTTMQSMFKQCKSLISLDLSSFNTANVTTMFSMFDRCESLVQLDLSKIDTSSVTNFGSMFYRCLNLNTLDVSGFKTAKATDMASMFYNCSSLTTLDVSGFNTANVTKMNSMFYNCRQLTTLDVSGFDTSNVVDMESMFSGCAALTSLDLRTFNTVKVTTMKSMFQSCVALTSLNLSNFNTSNVIFMDSMFHGCAALRSLDLSSFNTDKVTNVNNMFTYSNPRTVIFGQEFNNFVKFRSVIPENALVFVNDGTTLPEDKVNIVVGDKCEHLVINYGDSPNNQLYWQSPRNFTADKVTINRTFTKDIPSTLYLPFAMDATQYGTFYTGGEFNDADEVVTFSRVTDAQTTADTPYMFIPNQDFTEGITIEGPVAVTNLTGETEEAGLQGVYEKKEFTAEEAAQKIYYGWANGEFLWAEEGARVDACRAYFKLPVSAAAKAPARIKAKFGDDATGVDEIDSEEGNADTYNLNGQRVGEGYRGIVVRKGAKNATISR